MTKDFWEKLWKDLDVECEKHDFTWKEQKDFIAERVEEHLNKALSAIEARVNDRVSKHLRNIPTPADGYVTTHMVCSRCFATFGPGTNHQCPKEKK
jgi:hypothetical protein